MDSQTACRNDQRGRIGAKAYQILTKANKDPPIEYTHTIIWAPGHEDITEDLFADEVARDLTNHRAAADTAVEDPTPIDPNYATIMNYYRENRRTYTPPHKNLTAMESAAPRRLQTNTYTNLHRVHVFTLQHTEIYAHRVGPHQLCSTSRGSVHYTMNNITT